MCFSATASFIAGASLTGVGIATIRKVKSRSEIPFAAIPLLFGVQQLTEGVLWLSFKHEVPVLQETMTYAFIFFSRILWPMYVPFAATTLETVRWRKKVLLGFEIVGIALGFYFMYFIATRGMSAEVVGHHIVYSSPHFFPLIAMGIYISVTCLSSFFSSHAFVRIYGGLSIAGFTIAYAISEVASFSIWCFFAAILSLFIFYHFQSVNRKILEFET